MFGDYPLPYTEVNNENEPNVVNCQFCGFLCFLDSTTKCPNCGSLDYNNNTKSQGE